MFDGVQLQTQGLPATCPSPAVAESSSLRARPLPNRHGLVVTPKGSDKFPVRSFSYSVQRQISSNESGAERRELAAVCARGAIEAMMAEDVGLIYVSPPK